MTWLFVFIIVIILSSFANGQDFQLQREEQVEGVKGQTLRLKWLMVNVPDKFQVAIAKLYIGSNINKPLFNSISPPFSPKPEAVKKFGNRISATIINKNEKPEIYQVTLTNLQYNDTVTFTLNVVVYDGADILSTGKTSKEAITISKVKDPKKPGGGDPKKPGGGDPKKPGGGDPKKPGGGDPEKGSNTSAIVGGVIGGIVLIVLIVLGVLYFLRWKKNRGSS